MTYLHGTSKNKCKQINKKACFINGYWPHEQISLVSKQDYSREEYLK